MNIFRWIQSSYLRSSLVLALLYVAVSLGGKLAMRAGVPNAVPMAIIAVSAAILLTGVFVRSAGQPRWALVVVAGILAVGTPLAAIVAHDPAAWLKSPLGAMGYNWYYVLIVAGIPTSSRGVPACGSGSALGVIGGSLILVAASFVAARF